MGLLGKCLPIAAVRWSGGAQGTVTGDGAQQRPRVEWIVPAALGLVLGLGFLGWKELAKTKTGLQLIPTDPVKCVGSPADFKVKPDSKRTSVKAERWL